MEGKKNILKGERKTKLQDQREPQICTNYSVEEKKSGAQEKGANKKKNRKRITNNPASIIQRKQAANWLLWNLLKIFVRESLMFSMNLIIENQ